MGITHLRPHRRVVVGRNITLIAVIVYALARAVLYATESPGSVTGVDAFLTGNGSILWLWAAAWAAAAVLCVFDMANHHTRYGLSLVVGLTASWGFAYLIGWGVNGFTGNEWTAAIGWLMPAALIFGFLLKVTALHDMLNPDGAGEEQVANE